MDVHDFQVLTVPENCSVQADPFSRPLFSTPFLVTTINQHFPLTTLKTGTNITALLNGHILMARVLCTGIDAMLLQTRKMILESAGHEVITVMDEQSLVTLCKKRCFDVAVIGQTVTSKIKRRVSALIREHCPESKILELYQPHIGRSLEDADSWLVVPADIPMQLTERVNELSGNRVDEP